MSEGNLSHAVTGQLWQSPGGENYLVVDVMDLTSTQLIRFAEYGGTDREVLVFNTATGWKQISNFVQPVSCSAELRPH